MRIAHTISGVIVATMLSACAPSSLQTSPRYISNLQYQHYSCDQIRSEMIRIGEEVASHSRQQNIAARDDAILMAIGLVVFWPALIYIPSNDNQTDELAQLMGEHDALQQTGRNLSCFSSDEIGVLDEANAARAARIAEHEARQVRLAADRDERELYD